MEINYKRIAWFANASARIPGVIAIILKILLWIRRTKVTFVIGMSRSGTTFLGKAFTLAEQSSYLHEPVKFTLQEVYESKSQVNSGAFWDFVWSSKPSYRNHIALCSLLVTAIKVPANKKHICVKLVSVSLGIGDLASKIKANVVIIHRHPGGRTESVARQKGMVNTSIEWFEDQGAKWSQWHAALLSHPQRMEDWEWVNFEELCETPSDKIKSIVTKFKIPWDAYADRELLRMTSTDTNEFYGVFRDSKSQIAKWKSALSDEQVEAIRRGFHAVPGLGESLYPDF